MDTPESLVYRGQEGTGAAQIFGREGDPFKAIQIRKADQERRAAIDEAKKERARQERNKKMMDLIMVDPDKTFQPFNDQVLSAAEKHRAAVVDYFEKGGNPDDPKFLSWNKKGWGEVNDKAARGKYIENEIKQTMEQIKASPYLNTDHYFPKLFDLYMDENGNGKNFDDVDINKIRNIFHDDPSGFNATKYTKDFMGALKENVFNWKKQKNIANGIETDDVQVKVRGGLYNPDPGTASGVEEDENGNPVINATNDFINAFTANENAGRYIDQIVQQTGQSRKAVIESLVKPQGAFARDVKTTTSRNPQWYYDALNASRGGISPEQVPLATNRWENLNNSINAFYNPDGSRRSEPTPEAKAALGYLKKNVKMGGGDVIDAQFVAGTNTPGNSSINGMTVENDPNDRIVFSVKSGNRPAKPMTINLNDEGSIAELNGLFETAKTEGGAKFGVDQLLKFKGKNLSDLYANRAGLTAANEQAKAAENATVEKWVKAEEPDALVGRIHDGKRIKDVKVNKKPGVLGFGGGPQSYDVQYEDGSYGEIPLNYEELSKVYKGESTSSQPTVSSQEEYDKLPKGTKYMGPDGKTYIKK